MARRGSWSDLPDDILGIIATRLRTGFIDDDVNRFRSVCRSWRQSYNGQPYQYTSPLSSFNFGTWTKYYKPSLREFKEYKMYRLEFPPWKKAFLVRANLTAPNKVTLLCPPQVESLPKVLDLSECRISEICRAHRVFFGLAHKLVYVAPNSTPDSATIGIQSWDITLFLTSGDKKRTLDSDDGSHFTDLIHYGGKFYLIDRSGKTTVIDPFSEEVVVHIASPIPTSRWARSNAFLVECCGNLLLVQRRFSEYRVFKLNEENHNWVIVRDLGDQTLVLGGKGCSISVCAQDFAGHQENTIYHHNVGVFDLNEPCVKILGHRVPNLVREYDY